MNTFTRYATLCTTVSMIFGAATAHATEPGLGQGRRVLGEGQRIEPHHGAELAHPLGSGLPAAINAAHHHEAYQSRYPVLVPEVVGELPKPTVASPLLVATLRDGSGSMREAFGADPRISKAVAAGDANNLVILDTVRTFGRHGVGERANKADFIALVYGGTRQTEQHPWQPFVRSALPGEARSLSVSQMIESVRDDHLPVKLIPNRHGDEVPVPVWVKNEASGPTHMVHAMRTLREHIGGWQQGRSGEKHLVMVVHVTDGISRDGNPEAEIKQMNTEVRAKGGELVMTNVDISHREGVKPVMFPNDEDADHFDEHGRMLYEHSSPVPREIREQLEHRGIELKPGARMMGYNLKDPDQFMDVFRAGSSSAVLEE